MIKNYFLTAFRNLKRFKVYSIINITGLAIGIAACMLVFLFVRDEVSFDRFHQNIDQIYRMNVDIVMPSGRRLIGGTSPVMGPTVQAGIPEIESIIRVKGGSTLIRHEDEILRESFLYVDDDFFNVFSFSILKGNKETMLATPQSVVLDESTAKKYFGNEDPIGGTINMEFYGEYHTMTVSGVIKDMPTNSTISNGMLIPFSKYAQVTDPDRMTHWFDLHINTMVLVRKDAKPDLITEKLNEINRQHVEEEDNANLMLEPFDEIHLNPEIGGGNGLQQSSDPTLSYILIGVAVLILLIACINFTNLSIGISLSRIREIGIRKVIGADKKQLIAQFLGETTITTLLAFFLAILLIDLSLPIFNTLTQKELLFWTDENTSLILAAISMIVLTAVLSGFYPAWVVSGFDPVKSLKGMVQVGGKNRTAQALIVLQFSLAIFLLISVSIIHQQLNFVANHELGYNDQNLIGISTRGEDGRKLLDRFKESLQDDPEIAYVTTFTNGSFRTGVEVNGNNFDTYHERIDHDFLDAFEIELKEGRNFSEELTTDSTNSVIVNQAFIDAFNLEDPISKPIAFNYYTGMENPRIVGVVENAHFHSLKTEVQPFLFNIHAEGPVSTIWVKLAGDQVSNPMEKLENIWREFVPYRPMQAFYKSDQNQQIYQEEAQLRELIGYASMLAIIIGGMGLFGLASVLIRQRAKEMGIRKVLGARFWQLVSILYRSFVGLVGIALLIASPIAWYLMNGWLQEFAYHTTPGVSVFLFSGLISLGAALLAISYQAIKTVRVSPVVSLRDE